LIRPGWDNRLVDMKTLCTRECPASDTGEDLAEAVREYHLPDFSNWKNLDVFDAAFAPPLIHFRLQLISA
jgi:hypothetical protein